MVGESVLEEKLFVVLTQESLSSKTGFFSFCFNGFEAHPRGTP